MRPIVILGQSLNKSDGKVPNSLQFRIDKAVEEYNKERAPIIVTGADVSQVGRSEAAVGKELLMAQGIPEKDIILEEQAKNTYQNAMFCLPILSNLFNSHTMD